MKTSLAFAAIGFLSGAAAAPFDYSAGAHGSQKCALINVVMDESGSMGGDQAFMKDTALPTMARELFSRDYNYRQVFLCSTGFTNYGGSADHYRFVGCTTMTSTGGYTSNVPVTWRLTGGTEDGWHALDLGMQNVPSEIEGMDLLSTCATIDKNIILVTDEDRDAASVNTAVGIKAQIEDNGYVLNVVANIGISGDSANLGMKIADGGNDAVIYKADSSAAGGYTSYDVNATAYKGYVTRYGTTHDDYTTMIVGSRGAIWSINSLRDSTYAAAFAVAFTDVKVQEIAEGTPQPPLIPDLPTPRPNSESYTGGDPHFATWNNQHYEYHGQCDLTLMKDPDFLEGGGLDIQIRTKVVRFWSYIKSVAIKIGDDILEIEGSADAEDAEAHYWVNFEHRGELDTFAGFPVTQYLPSVYKRQYVIELSPTTSIVVQLYKEFVRVKFTGDDSIFSNTVGLLGDYSSGKLLARDGSTEMNDFTEFGDEWQVLPSEPNLFHEVSHPQFPELCVKPEDPRGERKRRLAESNVSIEAAEAACTKVLSDPLSIKDCVYDILATQDIDMVGAF